MAGHQARDHSRGDFRLDRARPVRSCGSPLVRKPGSLRQADVDVAFRNPAASLGAKDPGDRLAVLKELIEAGKVTPVIDRTFPLSQVPEAIRYLESGMAAGKVIITVGEDAIDVVPK